MNAPAKALLIVPTFDASILTNANSSAYQVAINTAITAIDRLYGDSGTVNVLFKYDASVLGGSLSGEKFIAYPTYTGLLAADAAAHPGNSVLATAVSNIQQHPGNTGDYVLATTALQRVALRVSSATPCYNSAGTFNNCGAGGVYDGIILLGDFTQPTFPGKNLQGVSVVEHELDEVLGGGGSGTTIGENLSANLWPSTPLNCSLTAIGPIDLYRYQSSTGDCGGITTTPSRTTDPAAIACYSIDGGHTALVQLNQNHNGNADYGDFATTPFIQDAFYPSGGTDPYSTLSPEYTMMLSIGYDAFVPEPSSLTLLAGALGGLGWVRRRRDAGRRATL